MAGIDSHLTYYFKHLEIINKYIFWNKRESNPSTCHHLKHAQNCTSDHNLESIERLIFLSTVWALLLSESKSRCNVDRYQ